MSESYQDHLAGEERRLTGVRDTDLPELINQHSDTKAVNGAFRRLEVVSIQYLRGVAAIGVVIFHIGQIFRLELKFGGSGVDIFFVISGFIMWMVTRRREAAPAQFIQKRLLRIVPLYWIATIFLALCASVRPNLFPLDHPIPSHVLLSLLFVPHLGPGGKPWPLITQGWTLNYEMFFYIVFAATLFVSKKRQFLLINIALLGCVAFGYLVRPSSTAGQVYTSPLLLEFLGGIYICRAWLAERVLTRRDAWIAVAVGLSGIVANGYLPAPLPSVLGFGIPAAAITLGAVSLEREGMVPKIRWLKLLGDASYSIYLTHYLAWLAVSIVLVKLEIGLNLPVYFLTVVIAIFAGVATYVCVERPAGAFLSNLLRRAQYPAMKPH
jgi:exopolysaccharide production protein ExoZ